MTHSWFDTRSRTWLDNHDDADVLTQAMVPARLVGTALSYDPRPYPVAAQRWLDHLPYIHRPPLEVVQEKPDWIGMGLVLWGPSGTGKTVMAVQMLRDILRKHTLDADEFGMYVGDMLGAFFDWQILSEHFRTMAGGQEPDAHAERIEACLHGHELVAGTAPRSFLGGGVVVLDDISRERPTEFNRDRLHHYLRLRGNGARTTIITTNYDPDHWIDVYGPVLGPYMSRSFIAAEVGEETER